jgi:hypothetical protein
MNMDKLTKLESFTGIIAAESNCGYYAVEWNGGGIMNVWFYNGCTENWCEVDCFTDNHARDCEHTAIKSAKEWLSENVL